MKYIIANWKMSMSKREVLSWIDEFKTSSSQREDSGLQIGDESGAISANQKEVLVAPSHLYLPTIDMPAGVNLCAQDVSVYEKGAHTGEVGAFQIKDYCKYCLVGHSERREAIETVVKKRDVCLEHNVIPIICFVDIQSVSALYKDGALLCWEDPANISSGGSYKPKAIGEIQNGLAEIRNVLPSKARVLYGGSVNRENAEGLARIIGLDGVLVGNASLDPSHFIDIIGRF